MPATAYTPPASRDERNAAENSQLLRKGAVATVPRVIAMISAEDEVRAHRRFDLFLFKGHHVHGGIGIGFQQTLLLGLCCLRVQNLWASFSVPSKHKNAPPTISKGHRPRGECADQQRRRHSGSPC